MADKHFINVNYKDLHNPGSRKFGYNTLPGRMKQIELSLARGSGSQPEIHWDITHESCDDDAFIKNPTASRLGANRTNTKLYYGINLPSIGGVEWTINVRFGDNPTQRKVANFVVWRRIMLSVTCAHGDFVTLFKDTMKLVKKAFEPAFIEVVTNGISVTGEKDPRQQERSGGSDCEMSVDLRVPTWETFKQKFELDVSATGVTGSVNWQKQGNLLVFDLSTHEEYRPQTPAFGSYPNYIESIVATREGDRVLKFPVTYHQQSDGDAMRALCKIRREGTPVTSEDDVRAATDIVIDLASAPMVPVMQELNAGRTVHLSMMLGLEEFGRSAGGATENMPAFFLTIYEGTTAKQLANVLTHEMAHTMYLVKSSETAADGTVVENWLYHDDSFGGHGPHCSANTKKIATGSTVSGFYYDPDSTGRPPCTMHYKRHDAVDDGKFCNNCIAQLRRAKLPAQLRHALDP